MHVASRLVGLGFIARAAAIIPPPEPEKFDIIELPLPPVSPSTDEGACTKEINPNGTGCIRQDFGDHAFQAGDFHPDGNHVVANVVFTGAPAAPDPLSIYQGEQVILIKADGTTFPNGDPWKCLSCGVPEENAQSLDPQRDYPHVFRSGDKVLWGHNILDCNGVSVTSPDCTPENTNIYPIHWTISADGSGPAGAPRELRLHPDDVHMGWSSFTDDGGQNAFFGRLEFNPEPTTGDPLVPRYELVDVNLLADPHGTPPIYAEGDELRLNESAISVGELRGFTGSGDAFLYIGSPREANNVDLMSVHVITGEVKRLTSHPGYVDPAAFSHDDEWFIAMDTRGTDRQMWMSGMRWIPPVIDLVTAPVAASTRNNGPRRFFQPILIDRYGDRGDYFGQQVNSEGDGSNGSVNDPNWNGRADPAFSPDGTKIVYWQSIVTPPSCGGENPLPCPESTAQGGRHYRIMLATRTGREPTDPAPVFDIPDSIPWAIPFPPGSTPPSVKSLEPGQYTLHGKLSGSAAVNLTADTQGLGIIGGVSVDYSDYSDQEGYVINGHEDVTRELLLPNFWHNRVEWTSDIVQTGVVEGTKKTSPGGLQLEIDVMVNILTANGTLTTTLDGVVYEQPANGT
ncbi:hypothetical protein VUR80DRAFT_4020 [Thermomyces stellatus]